MPKYNYFDDDDEVVEESKIESKAKDLLEKIQFKDFNLLDIINGIQGKITNYSKNANKQSKLRLSIFILIVICLIVSITVFSISIKNNSKEQTTFETNASAICNQYIAKYGQTSYEKYNDDTEDFYKITGLAYARQIDFDNNGTSELFICYHNSGAYNVEVWGFVDDEFKTIYSSSANTSTNVENGAWITLFSNNNKYYIGVSEKSTPETVTTFEITNNESKEYKTFNYSVGDGKFTKTNGKDVSSKFETIELSYIDKKYASKIVDTVNSIVDSFTTNSAKIEQVTANANASAIDRQKKAFNDICVKYTEKYGEGGIKNDNDTCQLTGLFEVELIDFNSDGTNELFLAYQRTISVRDTSSDEYNLRHKKVYCMDVYYWNGTSALKIFSDEGICNETDNDENEFYMFKLNNGKINICTVSSSIDEDLYQTGKYTAKIFKLSKDKFKPTYTAVVDEEYGYERYYIDGERVYNSYDFENEGYEVPYFYNSSKEADGTEYVRHLVKSDSTKSSEMYTILSNTKTTLSQLKS